MNLFCVKSPKFIKSNNIKVKDLIDGKINLHSCCINSSCKMFEAIDKEKSSDLLKVWIIYKTMLSYSSKCR